MIERLLRMDSNPLTCTHVNQLLHMTHEVGMTEGFFNYYFLSPPADHVYALQGLLSEPFQKETTAGLSSLGQLRWGLHRFFIDALLYFGGVRNAYEELSQKAYEDIVGFFAAKRFDADRMAARGPVLPFHAIPADDRYLIAELACKAYSPMAEGTELLLEFLLLKAYEERGGETKN